MLAWLLARVHIRRWCALFSVHLSVLCVATHYFHSCMQALPALKGDRGMRVFTYHLNWYSNLNLCARVIPSKRRYRRIWFLKFVQYHTLKEARAVNFSRSLLTNHLIYFYYRKLCCKSRFRSSELTFSIASNSPRTFYSKVTNNVSALKSDVCHWEKRCREKKVKYCGKFARLEKGSWKWNLHE